MKSIRQVDWKRTKIHASAYAASHDVWQRLEPGGPVPRTAADDVLEGRYEGARRDAITGRNRKQPYGRMSGSLSLSVAMDSADFGDQPTDVIADLVERRLRGKDLNRHQQGLVAGLRLYLADKASIRDCNPATIRGLLTALTTA
jgi:hypothetical protein